MTYAARYFSTMPWYFNAATRVALMKVRTGVIAFLMSLGESLGKESQIWWPLQKWLWTAVLCCSELQHSVQHTGANGQEA